MIILASASPRRKELMALVTGEFKVVASDVDEASGIKEPGALVTELARRKAAAVFEAHPNDVVIGADTIVYIDGEILGKPADAADARRMIEKLSGNTHTVYTGVCVMRPGGERAEYCATDVTFAALSGAETDTYLATENVLDKAGAYAIQGGAAKLIRRVDGCFFNVVGLPVRLLYEMLYKQDS